MVKTPDALTRLGRFVADAALTPDPATLAGVRDGVIDGLGCILAGVATDTARKAQHAVAAMAGQGAAPVLGTSMTAPRPQAALLNAVAAHVLDFDDWEVPGNTHPTSVLLPALLAASRPGTSGAALAQAYLAGFEVIARIGEAVNLAHYDRGWHATATLGAVGAAAAVARLRGLPADHATSALSIALSRAAGLTCQFGSDAKALQAGFAAETGVTACLLAEAGLTGQSHALDHPRGFAALTSELDPAVLTAALAKLGAPLALSEYPLALKAWPACAYTHRVMAAAVELSPLSVDEIDRVDLFLPEAHAKIASVGQPETRPEALFSLPFVAAMGLTKGDLTLADLRDARWQTPDIRAVVARINVHPRSVMRPDLTFDQDEPDRVEVLLCDGRTRVATCALPPGMAETPLSPAMLARKFRQNAGWDPAAPLDHLLAWPEVPDAATLLIRAGVPSPA